MAFAADLPEGTVYMKYGPRNGGGDEWYLYEQAVVSGNSIWVTLTDGGAGDADETANGKILDPGGPAVPFNIQFNPGAGGGGGNGGNQPPSDWRLVAIPGALPFKEGVPENQIVSMEAFLLGVHPDTGAPVSYYPEGSEGFVMRGSKVRSFLNLDGTMIENVRVRDLPPCSAFALKQGRGNATTEGGPSFMVNEPRRDIQVPQGWTLATFLDSDIHPAIQAVIMVGNGQSARTWFRGASGNTLRPADLPGKAAFVYFDRDVSDWRCGHPGT
jgi:hypothetical protein